MTMLTSEASECCCWVLVATLILMGSTNSDNDSDLSDSEDFLTHARAGNDLDREALVRKKLLENFYGKGIAGAVESSRGRSSRVGSFDSSDDDDGIIGQRFPTASSSDLDAPNFDAVQHTSGLIQRSSLHSLLETQEQLSLQTRTLDSTMQTLVYENYSRFIDATDAIKSIGVNVQANMEGLEQLGTRATRINETFGRMEASLGDLRDQVAEKIRVQRLLSRLDALLKLPQTIRQQIADGQYLEATQAHHNAVAILSVHSDSFESLQRIETECREILKELEQRLTLRLLAWSGHVERIDSSSAAADLPDPPKGMAEIFECAGTLALLQQGESKASDGEAPDESKDDPEADADSEDDFNNNNTLSATEIETMSMGAATRQLDRLLDTHLIDVQEQRYATPIDVPVIPGMEAAIELATNQASTSLVPGHILEAMVEAIALFGRHFEKGDQAVITEFVAESFSTFLIHVKGVLVEETHHVQENDSSSTRVNEALQQLESVVDDLSSKLAEIGIMGVNDETFAQQANGLTASLIRQRVDVQFQQLRLAVARDCLHVMGERAIAARKDAMERGETSVHDALVPIVKSTLNDCLQLVDDTIRSVLEASSTGAAASSTAAMQTSRQAVESSVRRFVAWLANVLQVMVGGGVSLTSELVQAAFVDPSIEPSAEDDNFESASQDNNISPESPKASDETSDLDLDTGAVDSEAVAEYVDGVATDLLQACQEGNNSDFILAIYELLKHGEKTLISELEASIATHMGGKKKSRGLFPDASITAPDSTTASDSGIGKCLNLAASQVLVLFATKQGHDIGQLLVADLEDIEYQDENPVAPRQNAVKALDLLKTTALQCAQLFGEDACAGPVPEMHVDSSADYSLGIRKTGLQLDVERMFMEKISGIFPHPTQAIESTRDAVIYLCCKVAFRTLVEHARLGNFTREGFQQVQVDVELVRLMLPYYLDDALMIEDTNACSALSNLLQEAASAAGLRCMDKDCLEDEEIKVESKQIVQSYMDSNGDDLSFAIGQ